MSLASRLKQRISILKPPGPEDVDEAGQPLDDYIPFVEAWSSIEPLSGRTLATAQQVSVEVTTRIVLRYREGIDRSMVARYQGIEFEFLYIIHKDYAKKELHIMCKERQ